MTLLLYLRDTHVEVGNFPHQVLVTSCISFFQNSLNMHGEFLFIDDQTRHQFYSQQTIQKFHQALTEKRTALLETLLWTDVQLVDKRRLVKEGKNIIYGLPQVISYIDTYIKKLERLEDYAFNQAVLPGDKPAIVCTKYLDWQYQIKEMFSFKLVENRIIGIVRNDKLPRNMIVAR